MEVAGYVRVSTEQQKEDNSHERQADRLRGWAERNGAEIEIFQDTAISGKDPNRDSYQKLMGDPSEDELGIVTEYDALVVREMSRFGRSLQQVTKDIERLDEHDTDFISLKEDLPGRLSDVSHLWREHDTHSAASTRSPTTISATIATSTPAVMAPRPSGSLDAPPTAQICRR